MPVNEIKRLLPRHYAILDLVLLGHGPKEIAEVLGITPQSAGMVINAPLFQDELARRRVVQNGQTDQVAFDAKIRAKQLLGQLSVRAVEVHEELLESSDESVRQRSASKILDEVFRSDDTPGNAPGSARAVVMSREALELLVCAMKESGLGSPLPQRKQVELISSTVVEAEAATSV